MATRELFRADADELTGSSDSLSYSLDDVPLSGNVVSSASSSSMSIARGRVVSPSHGSGVSTERLSYTSGLYLYPSPSSCVSSESVARWWGIRGLKPTVTCASSEPSRLVRARVSAPLFSDTSAESLAYIRARVTYPSTSSLCAANCVWRRNSAFILDTSGYGTESLTYSKALLESGRAYCVCTTPVIVPSNHGWNWTRFPTSATGDKEEVFF